MKPRKILLLLLIGLLVLALSGCINIPGANGVKAVGGGAIDTASETEDGKAIFAFNVQITQEPEEEPGETEQLEAKGRFQLVDIPAGFSINADVEAVLYNSVAGGDNWPADSMFFGAIHDPDKKVEGDELYVSILAQHIQEPENGEYFILVNVSDADSIPIYENGGFVDAGRIKIWIR